MYEYVRVCMRMYQYNQGLQIFMICTYLFSLLAPKYNVLCLHQQTGVLLWQHYDIWNKLCPLWHCYDTNLKLITYTKVWLLLNIMTKSRKTLLLHLWQLYYCHYDILNILWHLWLLLHYYIHYCISNYYNTYNIEVLLFVIMTNAKHYVHYTHYGYYINCHDMNNSHNSNNIFLLISTHKRGIWG